MQAIDRIGSAFLRRILRRMKELGMSQSELAARMKVSRPYITKVLRQDVNFSFRTAAKLANALRMDFFPDLRPQEASELENSPAPNPCLLSTNDQRLSIRLRRGYGGQAND